MLIVVTADQVDSRHGDDAVPSALRALVALPTRLPFERLAGDEIQGLTDDPDVALDALTTLLRAGRWSVGLGLGDVERPLPAHSREARGPAYVAARAAVERAKELDPRVAVVGAAGLPASDVDEADQAVTLYAHFLQERTGKGWEAAALADAGATGRDIADRLGITPGAVSQRLAAARYRQSQLARRLARSRLAWVLAGSSS